jgi:predicted metal-binding membrane protein
VTSTKTGGVATRPRQAATGLSWVLAAVALVALVSLSVWGASPYARYLQHGRADGSVGDEALEVGLFLTGWALMILAMMLPTTTKLLGLVAGLTTSRRKAVRLQLVSAAGFVLTWLLVGNIFRVGDVFVHRVVDSWTWLGARPHLVAAGVLLVAGVFQFSKIKRRCLVACRSPHSFLYRHWRGHGVRDALVVGAAYGLSCVGCCWALMLVMFGLGTMSVPWLLAVALVMAVEKNTTFGSRLTAPIGLSLITAALWVAT